MKSLKIASAAFVFSALMAGGALAQSGSTTIDLTKDGQTPARGITAPQERGSVVVNSNARVQVKKPRRHKVRAAR